MLLYFYDSSSWLGAWAVRALLTACTGQGSCLPKSSDGCQLKEAWITFQMI